MHFFVNFVQSRVPADWRQNSTGWVTGNCPMCVINGEPRPDRKRRGGFLFDGDKWRYYCFNCKYAAGWQAGEHMSWRVKKLLKQFGLDEADLQRAALELMREEETSRLLNPVPEAPPEFKPDWKQIELPGNAKFMLDVPPGKLDKNFEQALCMLSDRDLLHWHDWAYTKEDFKFRKRIILPYRYKGNIVGYNARYIGDPPRGTPKYIVSKPTNFVFNLDRQNSDRSFVVVLEGDFDAISIDGVSLGTNSVSDEQASLINQLKKRVIVLPDSDAAGKALVEPAIKQGWSVAFPEWMEYFKDANLAAQKYGRAFVLQSIISSAVDNPTKIRVLSKRYLQG